MAVVETASYEREPGVKRISWGAIIAGALLALIILFTLSVLGAAIGLTVLDPSKREPAEGLGIGATVWWLVSTIIALFVGGWSAAKLSAVWTKTNGILHGLVTWALTLVVMGWLLTSAAGAIMGGALSALQSGMQAGAQAADQGTIQQLQQKVEELAGKAKEEAEQQTEQEKEEAAEKAADVSAAAAWGSFIMLMLGAISAAVGGCFGAHCNKRQIEKGPYAAHETRERR